MGGGTVMPPPFRRLAIVLSPVGAVHTLLEHADMLARLWAPPALCLIAPEDVEIHQLPSTLAAAREEGRATIRHVRDPLLDAVLHEIVAFHADLLLVGSGRSGDDRRSGWSLPAPTRRFAGCWSPSISLFVRPTL